VYIFTFRPLSGGDGGASLIIIGSGVSIRGGC